MDRLFSKKWLPFALLGLATLLVWGQTVQFGFVWDDEYFIRDLQSIRSLRHIPEMFYRLDAQATLPQDFRVFRPVRTAHYALLYFLAGRETPPPWIYHLANVFWHGCTAIMLYLVLTQLLPRLRPILAAGESRLWSLLIALAFAVHPVVSEVVCWAKSLDDILAAFFALAALRELLRAPENEAAKWRGPLLFALAVYSKESAVPFAILPFLTFHKIHHRSWKQSAVRAAPFCFIAAFYMAHRHLVIGRSSQTEPLSGSYGQTLVDMLPVVLKYFRLLWGIPPFCIDYSFMRRGGSVHSAGALGGLAVLVILALAGIVAWRKHGMELAGFGLLWTGLFLLPVSNLLPMMQYMAERFLYLPLIGWLIAFGGIALALPRQRLVRPATLLLVCLWAVAAWNRSWIWRDGVTLFVASSQQGPKTPRVENNAVAAILRLPHIEKFFSYNPRTEKLDVLGAVDPASAASLLRTFEEAYRLFPEHPKVLTCYGITLAVTGQPAQAVPLLERAARLEPQNLDYRLNLARAELDANELPAAQATLDAASVLGPDNAGVLRLRFKYDWLTTNYPAARDVISRLNQIAPSPENAHWLSEVEQKLKP